MPIESPFHSRTAQLSESRQWKEWSGYFAPVTYDLVLDREYYAIRTMAGLIDISPLFKYDLIGADSARAVERIFTRDISRLAAGQVAYTPWCNAAGLMLDDGLVWRLAGDHFRITSAEPHFRWFQDCTYGLEVEIVDLSERLAALALQGPNSREILVAALEAPGLEKLGYHHFAEGPAGGTLISRSGYTGQLGFELWTAPENAEALWDRLMIAGLDHGLQPAGLAALDMVRIEAGLILNGVDYLPANRALTNSMTRSPFEVGLGWAVDLESGREFIGRSSLERESTEGSKLALVGLEAEAEAMEQAFAEFDLPATFDPGASRSSAALYLRGNRQVGQATSRLFSPLLKKYIALATVERAFAPRGTILKMEVAIDQSTRMLPVTVVDLPFFSDPRLRTQA